MPSLIYAVLAIAFLAPGLADAHTAAAAHARLKPGTYTTDSDSTRVSRGCGSRQLVVTKGGFTITPLQDGFLNYFSCAHADQAHSYTCYNDPDSSQGHICLSDYHYLSNYSAQGHYLGGFSVRRRLIIEEVLIENDGSLLITERGFIRHNYFYQDLGHYYPGKLLAHDAPDGIQTNRWSLQK